MSVETKQTIRVTHRFTASPERVFDAWLDPDKARQFLFATPEGQMIRAEIDPRVGGRFIFIDRRAGGDTEHLGEYLEIDRPRRLIFTFAVPEYSAEYTRVTIDIEPLQGGGCELTLTHEGVLPEYADQTKGGWRMILEGAARTVD